MRQLAADIGAALERAIGSAGLSSRVRAHVWSAQLRSIQQLAVIVWANASLVAAVLLFVAAGGPGFPIVAAASLLIIAVHGAAIWQQRQADVPTPENIARLVRWVTSAALVLGVLWAVMLNALPFDDPVVGRIVWFAIAAIATATAGSLIYIPGAAIAFVVPLVLGALIAALRSSSAEMVALHIVIAIATAVTLWALGLRFVHTFIRQKAEAFDSRQKSEIIRLLLKELAPGATDWTFILDRDGKVEQVSTGFAKATTLSEEDIIGASFDAFLANICAEGDLMAAEVAKFLNVQQPFGDVELKIDAGGADCWWRISGSPTFDPIGGFVGFVGTVSDISQKKLTEQRLTSMAHNDPLTGLLNRTKFSDQLKSVVGRLERYGTPFALMYLDLDNFKLINDSRGHLMGDKLLIRVAETIRATVRESDLVARLGGDEFAILIGSDAAPEQIASMAQRLIDSIMKPLNIDGENISVGLSIGIALAPVNGTRPDQLLRNADLALYRAKADGRSVYRFFESKMDADARERRLLEMELSDALAENQLVLHFQPVVAAGTQRATGFEALMRWNHPIRGQIQPSEFIPIAERSNLIKEIGDWTIREACRVARTWPNDLSIAVNMSAMHFKLSNIREVVMDALHASGLEPHRLELEITEGLLIDDAEAVARKLNEMRELGVTIVMDDFGTGYSSLSYLLTFPFDRIKIDQSFVAASTRESAARDILRAVTSLGRSLNLGITAEGVETQAQADFLSEIACNHLQGFYFARPLDEADIPAYLLRQVTDRTPLDEVHGKRRVAAQ